MKFALQNLSKRAKTASSSSISAQWILLIGLTGSLLRTPAADGLSTPPAADGPSTSTPPAADRPSTPTPAATSDIRRDQRPQVQTLHDAGFTYT
jgi:hypothetical protein